MAFILSKDFDSDPFDDISAFNARWDEYRKYLKDLKGKVPDSTYEFANADWHYNPEDARCPHDAWLEEVDFGEVNEAAAKFNLRAFNINVRLLGPYHNGHIELTYKDVYRYSFDLDRQRDEKSYIKSATHGDWLYDEIRLADDGSVVHEIEWAAAHWIIECADVEYKWLPFDPAQTTNMMEVQKSEQDSAVYQTLQNGGTGVFSKPGGVITVAGTEAVQFLNGLITNDVQKLADNTKMLAAFPNVQGRLLALVTVLRRQDKFTFITDAETYEKVLQNLERFTLAGDFKVEDLSGKMDMLQLLGKTSVEILAKALETDAITFTENEVKRVNFNNATLIVYATSGFEGLEILGPKNQIKELRSLLFNSGAGHISAELYETLRIENGVPKYGVDMDETTVVLETGIDEAVSFTKGCYIGQEIIARIHFRGHVAKKLTGLILSVPPAVAGGLLKDQELTSSEGKSAGRITSFTYSPRLQKTIALALVRYEFLAEGTELKAGDHIAKVANFPVL